MPVQNIFVVTINGFLMPQALRASASTCYKQFNDHHIFEKDMYDQLEGKRLFEVAV
jgi:hypothetical protein